MKFSSQRHRSARIVVLPIDLSNIGSPVGRGAGEPSAAAVDRRRVEAARPSRQRTWARSPTARQRLTIPPVQRQAKEIGTLKDALSDQRAVDKSGSGADMFGNTTRTMQRRGRRPAHPSSRPIAAQAGSRVNTSRKRGHTAHSERIVRLLDSQVALDNASTRCDHLF